MWNLIERRDEETNTTTKANQSKARTHGTELYILLMNWEAKGKKRRKRSHSKPNFIMEWFHNHKAGSSYRTSSPGLHRASIHILTDLKRLHYRNDSEMKRERDRERENRTEIEKGVCVWGWERLSFVWRPNACTLKMQFYARLFYTFYTQNEKCVMWNSFIKHTSAMAIA